MTDKCIRTTYNVAEDAYIVKFQYWNNAEQKRIGRFVQNKYGKWKYEKEGFHMQNGVDYVRIAIKRQRARLDKMYKPKKNKRSLFQKLTDYKG